MNHGDLSRRSLDEDGSSLEPLLRSNLLRRAERRVGYAVISLDTPQPGCDELHHYFDGLFEYIPGMKRKGNIA